MALLKILTWPDPFLKKVAKPVEKVDEEVRTIMKDMLDTMYNSKDGCGLAATQVGIDKRILVMDVGSQEAPEVYQMANPEIVYMSKETECRAEACLSLPGVYEKVERPKIVRIKYLNENNQQCEIEADELLSICVQHEIDHLNGKVFIERIGKLKMELAKQKLLKKTPVMA